MDDIWTHNPTPDKLHDIDLSYNCGDERIKTRLETPYLRQRFVVHVDGNEQLRDTIEDTTGTKLYRPGWKKILDFLR